MGLNRGTTSEGSVKRMAQYRKKPVVIEAIQWTGRNHAEIEAFAGEAVRLSPIGSYSIRTLEGVMFAERGDWVIRGVQGEFYPCKPDIFEATYVASEGRG